MKNKNEVLEFESVILMREMSKPKWYKGFYTQSYASKMKLRLQEKTLHRFTIKELMDHFGYEKVVDPVDAMYRKKEIRLWNIFEDGELINVIKAETKEEALQEAASIKYGDKETKDFKGRVKTLAELAICDMKAEEVI